MRACKFTIQRQFLGAGVLTLALLTAACSGEETAGQEGDPAAKLLASAEKTAQAVASDIAEALGTPAKQDAPETPPAPAPKTVAPSRRAKAVQPKPASSVEPARVAAIEEAPSIESSPEVAAPVEEDTVVEALMTRPLDHTVYSAADTDVVPPTPPVASGLRPWRVQSGPAVEVIVANDGSVEKVQVLGTTHMSDALILSHVKAWKFAPAMRGGDPVRYRLLLEDPVVP
jgi:hypothetical protein